MTNLEIITIITSVTSLFSIIAWFLLQRDQKKIRDLESDNKKYKTNYSKALRSIEWYQKLEEYIASKDGKNISAFRSSMRKKIKGDIDSKFMLPSNIQERLQELRNEWNIKHSTKSLVIL